VIAKEIGNGISERRGRALLQRGIRMGDTGGQGGTSWARIEAARSDDHSLGERFATWGIPTPESIRQLSRIDGLYVIGSGGLRSGLDVAKAIALGAHLGAMAYPFLRAAEGSTEDVVAFVGRTIRELEICMFCVGARTLSRLSATPLRKRA